jgi:hypothetical protein
MNENDSSRTLEFVVLDSAKDGIAQITSALLRYNGIDGMHIVSHGGTGHVQLGSTWLSINNLDIYRNAISAWQYSMSEQADILFYGCNLAGSEDGQRLLQEMSILTDSDVAASEDSTGGIKRNADWDLEYQIGTITTDVAFSNEFEANADFILATYTVTNTNDSGRRVAASGDSGCQRQCWCRYDQLQSGIDRIGDFAFECVTNHYRTNHARWLDTVRLFRSSNCHH